MSEAHPEADYWVFGYGSLMWHPGFPHLEALPALLHGYHRGFVVYSHRYRGTRQRPGLVLGLDRGGSCHGVAFRVPAAEREAVRAYLWEREMVSNAYLPKLLPVRTAVGCVTAQTFVVERDNPQYAGKLSPEAAAALIATSEGQRGLNIDYLDSTVEHLKALGIHDRGLERLAERAHQLIRGGTVVRPDHPEWDGPAV